MESKEPWNTEEGKSIWKTEAEYWGWLRGALRQLWSAYPLRKEWKRRQLRPVSQEEKSRKVYHPSTRNVGMCVLCKEWMAGSKLECDHKLSSSGCTSKETAEEFLWHCGGLVGEYFQLVCKPCHKVKSYADRWNLTFEEAVIEKKVIAISKDATTQRKFLLDNGVEAGKNEKIRKQQIRNIIIGDS